MGSLPEAVRAGIVPMVKVAEIRVAGQTPAEFDAETVRLLLERIQQRRKTQEAVKARWN